MYADLLAARIKGHHRMRRDDVAHVLHREWPLLQASLAARRAARTRRARHPEWRAWRWIWRWSVGVAALVGWGVVFSRREGHGLAGIIAAASLNAAVGLIIVGLKVAVR